MTDALLAKYCGIIQNEDKKKRKKGLEDLSKFLQENGTQLEVTERVETFKNILRCFNDKTEACREVAVNAVADFILKFEENDQYLMYLMPVLLQRIGGQDIVEPSEEVRLLQVSLLHNIVAKYNPELLPTYLNDIIQILVRTLVDPYPKIKKESCECAATLAAAMPIHFYMQSQSLITPMLQSVTHQHYRVRCAAISSLGKVVRYGNNKSLTDVIGPLAERLFDQTPMVRQTVVGVVGMWLVELPDRYSYFHKLLPLVLTGLTDEIDEIREETFGLWDKAGKLYMQENENDLKDQMDFLTKDSEHYPPFETRPNLGCRTLVNRNLCKIVPAVVRELEDWLVDIRVKSSQLLYALLLNAETNITHHLEKILIGMYRASSDEDIRVADNVEKAAELIGYFVPPDVYCKLVLPTMEESANAGQLRIFASILRGSERSSVKEKLTEIGDFLKRPDICRSKETLYQLNLLNCCLSLMYVSEEDCSVIGYHLFVVAVSVLGLASSEIVTSKSLECMHMLQSVESCSSVQDLFKKHVEPLLEEFRNSAESWSLYSPERFIFEAILTYSGYVVGLHLPAISSILTTCLKPDKDPEVKLKIFTVLSTRVIGKDAITTECSDTAKFFITLVRDVIIPNLVWKAGRTAEAIRTAAIACLFVAFQISKDSKSPFLLPENFKEALEPLMPLLPSLVEDCSKKTRLFTCQTLCRMMKLARATGLYNADLVHHLYPVVMKRLDDVSDDVRLAAIKVLVTLFKPLPADYCMEVSFGHLEALFSTMLIHLDDPDRSFQMIILAALKDLADLNPTVLHKKVVECSSKFRTAEDCKELMKHMIH